MYEAVEAAQVAAEMTNYKVALLGLCETRWTQSGQLRLSTGEAILYSGHEEEDALHTEGVALMEAQGAVTRWEKVSPKIIRANFRTKMKNINIDVVQCYGGLQRNGWNRQQRIRACDEQTWAEEYERERGIVYRLAHWTA